MAKKLLISEVKLKAFTNINKNVDIDAIRAEIGIAQDIHLQNLLGSPFYHHLLDQVTATGNTFNADELILVNDYVADYLIQTSYFEMIPQIHFRTMNVGIVEPAGVDGGRNGVDIETMKYLRGIQKQRSDFYQQRLQDYLITGRGQNKFPQYLATNTIDGMVPDRSAKYNSPITLFNTTRTGLSRERIRRTMPSYSEIESSSPPCADCY
jgi:hypothetical protein